MSNSVNHCNDSNGNEVTPLYEHDSCERRRLSLPGAHCVKLQAPSSRRLSESHLANCLGDTDVGTRLTFLKDLLAAREQLRVLQTSSTAKERRKTWMQTQEDVNDCISTILRDTINIQLDASDTALSEAIIGTPPPQSAFRYNNDVNSHEDVEYRISRHLREPIIVSDEETDETGKPLRVETALDAYQRGEFSTGEPDAAHLPSGLRTPSSPGIRYGSLIFGKIDKGRDPIGRKCHSVIDLDKKSSILNDQFHIHPALRTPIRAATIPAKKKPCYIDQSNSNDPALWTPTRVVTDPARKRLSFIDQSHTHPAVDVPPRRALRYQFLDSSDEEDDHWRSTRTSSTLIASCSSGSGGGQENLPRIPHLTHDGIIPPLPRCTTANPSPTQSPPPPVTPTRRRRRPLTDYTLTPLTTPTRKPKSLRLTPTPLPLSPPTPPPARPPPLLPLEAQKPHAHRSQLLDALTGATKGTPTRLCLLQDHDAAGGGRGIGKGDREGRKERDKEKEREKEQERKEQAHQSRLLDTLLGVERGEMTRLGLLTDAVEAGASASISFSSPVVAVRKGLGGTGGGNRVSSSSFSGGSEVSRSRSGSGRLRKRGRVMEGKMEKENEKEGKREGWMRFVLGGR